MNKVFSIIITLAVLLVGCNKAVLEPFSADKENGLIVGIWQWEYTLIYDDPDDPETFSRDEAEEDAVVREIFNNNGDYAMEFYAKVGGVLEVDFGLDGRYEMSNDKKVLRITIDGLGTTENKIVDLTEDTFVYEEIDEDGIRSVYHYFKVLNL